MFGLNGTHGAVSTGFHPVMMTDRMKPFLYIILMTNNV
jgi:hypothetical protein